MKKSSVGKTNGEVETSKRIRASLLPVSDLSTRLGGPASLSYSLVRLAGGLLQRLCQAQDPGAIVIEI